MPHSNIIVSICFFVLALFSFTRVASEAQFPCFFVFGDSLVDNGNNNNLETMARADYSPYGIDFPAGPTGRFNNGRNIVDFLAHMLGFDKFIPPFVNATDQDILVGVNYGSGGAGILDDSGSVFGDVITLKEQVLNHEVAISRLSTLLGSKRAAKKHLHSCLYYVGMGSNDYLGNFLPKYYASASNYTPKQFAALAIKQFSKQLKRLYYNGARKVAVLALGKIGCIPQQIATYPVSNSTGCVETSNDVARIFNEKLQLLLNGLNKRLPGAEFVYATDISTDESYGNITELIQPCCTVSEERLGHCEMGGAVCSNRDDYYFWDSYHPTDAAVKLSANVVYDSLSPLFLPHLHLVDVM